MINEQDIQKFFNERCICAEIHLHGEGKVEINVDSDWKEHIALQNFMAEHGFKLIDKNAKPSDSDWCEAVHTYKYDANSEIEIAMIAHAKSNNLMCKAIENYLIYELAEGDNTKHVKVTFSKANRIDCATNSPILGVEYRPTETGGIVCYQDEDGNDDIDDGGLTANELYEVCLVLHMGGNHYDYEVTNV